MKSTPDTMLRIDDREPTRLKNHDWGTETEVERLEVSDYIVNGVIIERKEINDLVGSLEGRLWEQVHSMEESVAEGDNTSASLVVHGTVADLSSQNMEPRKIEGIYGAIGRIMVSYDVNVIWVREETQFIKIVKKLCDKAGSEASKRKPHLTKRSYRDDRVNVLYGIYGVGYDTATNLLEEFGSISQICEANKRDLQSADGVGAKTAKKVHDILHDGEEHSLLD